MEDQGVREGGSYLEQPHRKGAEQRRHHDWWDRDRGNYLGPVPDRCDVGHHYDEPDDDGWRHERWLYGVRGHWCWSDLGKRSVERLRCRGHAVLGDCVVAVSYTHLRAHETPEHLVCRLLLE